MKAEERRKAIALHLYAEQKAISGGELAKRFGVSRQIIVQDIAKIKDDGYQIQPTHSGYLLTASPLKERTFKTRHSAEQTEDALLTIINLGGIVKDDFVWHKVYGKINVHLNLYTAEHVKDFIDGVRSGKSVELMHVTGGYHYLSVLAKSEKTLDEIGTALEQKGYIAPEVNY